MLHLATLYRSSGIVDKVMSNSVSLPRTRSPGSVCLCSVGECYTLCDVPANTNPDCLSRVEVEAMLHQQESSIRTEMNIRLLSQEDQITKLTQRVHTLENCSHSSSQAPCHTSGASRTGLHYSRRYPQSSRAARHRSSLQNHPNPPILYRSE